jgi:type VI secretion system protein ImpC
MPDRLSFGPVELTARLGQQPAAAPPRPEPETPFKILVLGNFSGPPHGARTGRAAALKPIRVDLDNQDTVLETLDVRLELPFGGLQDPPVSIRIQSLEDFHPDQWARQIPWFKQVHEIRRQLQNPATFREALAQIQNWIPLESPTRPASAPSPSPATPSPSSAESTDGMLERLLGRPATGETAPQPAVDIGGLIQEAVRSSVVPSADPRQDEWLAALDAAVSRRLNSILHHPNFQSLESAWRGLDFLIKNIELDETLHLYLLDVSKEDLVQDLSAAGDMRSSRFYEAVFPPTVTAPGGQPWAVWAANHTFTHREADPSLLAALGRLGQEAGAPFLAAMDSSFLELETHSETAAAQELEHWNALRRLPEASFIGLALPRLLLRLPYGQKTDPVAQFDFEEMPGRPDPKNYLWGSPALACACLLGQSFSQNGWNLSGNLLQKLEGLPLHVYKEDGESKMTPCAEVWLNDTNSDDLLKNGLIPLQSIQGRDAIRIARWQSIHHPLTPLAGRWS